MVKINMATPMKPMKQSNGIEEGSKRPRYDRRPSTIVLFAAIFACSIISYSHIMKLTAHLSSSLLELESGFEADAPSLLTTQQQQRSISRYPIDEAEFIIQKSYAETYARMFPCKDEIVEKECIAQVVKHLTTTVDGEEDEQYSQHHFQVPSDHPYPWWFQTLLRDIPTNGAYGPWHHFSTLSTDPPLRFCAIGKNGSTEWRKIFKALNAPEYCEEELKNNNNDTWKCSKFKTLTKLSVDPSVTPRTVFIRDPLERLLSGYLDKCVKPGIRLTQGHCEPNIVFGVDFLARKAKNERRQQKRDNSQQQLGKEDESLPDLTEDVQDLDKEMFAAYVDLLPLQWNVHFVPQALFCDLYRHIDTYDFVGVMGKQFMAELDRMANRYGGLLPEVLENTFRYQSKLVVSEENVGMDKNHGTKSPEKVARYYSARAVRRALEYLSIDYVTLGLEVPEWAREMLHNDDVE